MKELLFQVNGQETDRQTTVAQKYTPIAMYVFRWEVEWRNLIVEWGNLRVKWRNKWSWSEGI